MRVTSLVPDIQSGIQQSEQALQVAVQQLTTGKRVNQLSDDPAASAALVRNLAAQSNVDQYTKNASSVLSETQTADAGLSSVVTSLNQTIALGTEGAGSDVTSANRQAIAGQVQAALSNVISQANLSFHGSYLFGGTATGAPPFTANSTTATGYQYNGNSGVNSVQVGDSQSTVTNVPGDQIFNHPGADVIASLSSLVTALQTGTSTQIATATAAVTTALNYVGQQRVIYGNISGQLTTQESYLSQETLSLSVEQTSLVSIDLSVAATNLSQAQLNENAVFAAAAKVLPNTLLNYLK